MGKVKDGFKNLGKKIKAIPGNTQGKAFARILQFFAVMIALTIFVKGAAGVTMPKVTAESFTQNEITDSIDAYGTVTASSTEEIKLPTGLVISKIVAPAGTNVKEGDKLIEFDTSELEKTLLAEEQKLITLRLDLRKLQNASGLDTSSVEAAQKAVDNAKKGVETAQATYASVKAQGEADVAAARNAVTNAEALLQLAIVDRDAKKAEYDADNTNDDKKQLYMNAEAAVVEAEQNLLVASQNATANIAAAERKAADDLRTAQAGIDSANSLLADANKNLEEANKKLEEAKKDQSLIDQQTKLAIQQKQAEIESQCDVIDDLKKVIDGAGVLTATLDGTVSDVNVNVGDTTTNTSYVRISTGREGYSVECFLTNEQAKQIKLGSTMYVTVDRWGGRVEAKVVTKSAPDTNGQVRVRATLPQNYGWSEGDSLQVQVVLSSRMYWNTVPISAIHTDSEGSFVYMLVEEKTILGTQSVARRAGVEVQEPRGKDIAAIDFTDGYFYDAKVIVSSTKPLNDGDWVRVENK